MCFNIGFSVFLLNIIVCLAHERTPDHHHTADGSHDASFDHEAFLGKDQAAEFDQLSPEESKIKLKKLLPAIDLDNDTFITKNELMVRINKMGEKYVQNNVDTNWNYHPIKDEKLAWADYRRSVTGVLNEDGPIEDPVYDAMIKKDKARWKVADRDGDNVLTKEEFKCVMHPEDCQDIMRDILIQESMENFDKNKDGYVDWDEYISDIYNEEDAEDLKKGIEPEWMTAEKETFKQYKDKDGDFRLNIEEVGEWLFPVGYKADEIESQHLIDMADDNTDGKLSFDEIINHADLFVGSQTTAYGEALKKHDPTEF